MYSQHFSYPYPQLPSSSTFPFCNLDIHHRLVLMTTNWLLQTRKPNNHIYPCENRVEPVQLDIMFQASSWAKWQLELIQPVCIQSNRSFKKSSWSRANRICSEHSSWTSQFERIRTIKLGCSWKLSWASSTRNVISENRVELTHCNSIFFSTNRVEPVQLFFFSRNPGWGGPLNLIFFENPSWPGRRVNTFFFPNIGFSRLNAIFF